MDESTLLQQAIAAARAGRKAEAWRLLAQVLHQNQRNELAWLWLSSVVDSEEQRVKCLENVLMISPNNTAARNGLAQLQAPIGAAPATPRPATPPSTVRCPHCGTPNRIGSLFCKKCGQSLEQPKSSPTASPPVTPCPHCGATNRAGATFCSGCGQGLGQMKPSPQAQTVRCSSCGFDNPAGFRFCSKCGQGLGAAGSPSPPPAVPPQSAHHQPQRPQPQRSPAQAVPVPAIPPKAASPAPPATPPMPKPASPVPRPASPASAPRPVSARAAVARQRSLPNSIFCVACGAENPDGSSACIQCGHPITMPSPAEVQQLIAIVQNNPLQKERIRAIRKLGRLKTRAAVPQLIKSSHLTGSKNAEEARVATYAVAQIIDVSESPIVCVGCSTANPSDAKFCHSCGAQITHPTATPEEIAQLIALVQNSSGERQLQIVERLGQLKARAAAPVLLNLVKQMNKGLGFKIESLLVLEALMEIGEPAVAPELSSFAKKCRLRSMPASDSCIRALVKLNRLDTVMRYFEPLIKPTKQDEYGKNLAFVLRAAKVCGAKAISPLCNNIMREKRRWRVGKGSANSPLMFLLENTTFAIIERIAEISVGKEKAAAMVVSDNVMNGISRNVPAHVCMMVSLHCYSTALATIASHDPVPVKAELSMRTRPLERAVIGLALAQSGDLSVEDVFKPLRSSSNWPVRLLAYEGLAVLADVTGRAPGPSQLAALQDHDVRVRTAVARVMADTGDATYTSHILALTNSSDKVQRRAILPVIAILASSGHQPSVAKLRGLAQGDPDEQVREGARAILQDISSSSVP